MYLIFEQVDFEFCAAAMWIFLEDSNWKAIKTQREMSRSRSQMGPGENSEKERKKRELI